MYPEAGRRLLLWSRRCSVATTVGTEAPSSVARSTSRASPGPPPLVDVVLESNSRRPHALRHTLIHSGQSPASATCRSGCACRFLTLRWSWARYAVVCDAIHDRLTVRKKACGHPGTAPSRIEYRAGRRHHRFPKLN